MKIERHWLKVSEAAEYLGLHPKSIYRGCRRGYLPFSRVPGIGIRIDKRELDGLLKKK